MTREMPYKQFIKACLAEDFNPILGGLWLRDTSGITKDIEFGAVINPKTGRIYYRQTLARAIKLRTAIEERKITMGQQKLF